MDSKPLPLISRTGLIVLALAYAIALPWLIWSEAVKLVPLLCALVFATGALKKPKIFENITI